MNCIDLVAREHRLIAAEGIHCLKRKCTAFCRIVCRLAQISCSEELQVFHNYLPLLWQKMPGSTLKDYLCCLFLIKRSPSKVMLLIKSECPGTTTWGTSEHAVQPSAYPDKLRFPPLLIKEEKKRRKKLSGFKKNNHQTKTQTFPVLSTAQHRGVDTATLPTSV